MIDNGSAIGRDQGRSQVAQEDQDDQNRQGCTFEQGLDGGVVVPEREIGRGIDQGEIDFRVGCVNDLDLLGHGRRHHHVAGSLGAEHAEADDRLAIDAGEGPRLYDRVRDAAEVVEADLAAARQDDDRGRDIADGLRRRQGPDRLVLAADLGSTARHIDLGAAQLPAHIRCRQIESLQAIRIEHHGHFALDSADAVDLADATDPLKGSFDDVVDEIGKLLGCSARRCCRVGHGRQPYDIDALDQRLHDVLRQARPYARDRIFDIVEGASRIGVELELHHRRREAVGDVRDDMMDALDARQSIFDRLRDVVVDLGRCRSELRDSDRDDRNIDVRKAGDRQGAEVDGAEDDEDRRYHDGG